MDVRYTAGGLIPFPSRTPQAQSLGQIAGNVASKAEALRNEQITNNPDPLSKAENETSLGYLNALVSLGGLGTLGKGAALKTGQLLGEMGGKKVVAGGLRTVAQPMENLASRIQNIKSKVVKTDADKGAIKENIVKYGLYGENHVMFQKPICRALKK